MKTNHDETFFERLRWACAHGALADRLGRSIRRALYAAPHDSLARQLALKEIRELERLKDSGLLPPFKAAQLNIGELILGLDVHGHRVLVPLRWLC